MDEFQICEMLEFTLICLECADSYQVKLIIIKQQGTAEESQTTTDSSSPSASEVMNDTTL